jgi:hypothetical protein
MISGFDFALMDCPSFAHTRLLMNSKTCCSYLSLVAALLLFNGCATDSGGSGGGWVRLDDGKTFNGWKKAEENQQSWSISDGAFVAHGPRSHLYYVGPLQPFTDFELKVDVMTATNSNGGIYIDTRYQPTGWPKYGFETQVNVSHSDWKKTGSIYDVANVKSSPAKDNQWWTQHIIVRGNRIIVKVNEETVVDYTEPPGKVAGEDFTRKIEPGTIAFQAHDPNSIVRYKNVRVRKL